MAPPLPAEELTAENGLFQPILTMAQKRPRPGHTRVRAKQPTIYHSGTTPLDALRNLVPPDFGATMSPRWVKMPKLAK